MKRRTFVKGVGLICLASGFGSIALPRYDQLIHRIIPSTGERIPAMGMGSWITFDVRGNSDRMRSMEQVLSKFHEMGGRVIDSSPMYGSSEEVIGILSRRLGISDDLWVSTKVWTHGKQNGIDQIDRSNSYFNDRVMVDHVHNVRDFKTHYESLKEAKAQGRIRYIGITHYVNGMHPELANLVREYDLDFVQVNFNIANPHAEERLLPIAKDHGTAVIINRPLHAGRVFDLVGAKSLPEWAREWGIRSWAGYFLKYVVSHAAVTCAIPATSQVAHVIENMEAGKGFLPSGKERIRMLDHFRSIT